jgi:SAM-dependent methyltransferase
MPASAAKELAVPVVLNIRRTVGPKPEKSTALQQRLHPWAIQLYRTSRTLVYRALTPFDFLSRLINNKKDLPPISLRRYVGDLRNFESSGAEFAAYLKLIAKLQQDEALLDIGCGCGMIALNLLDYLGQSGRYAGVDIDPSSIGWCQRNITPRNPRFQFQCLDIRNDVYRPRAKQTAANIVMPFEAGSFDVIILKSVFTHLVPVETDNYLKEISRLLSPQGRCLATFFLFNQTSAAAAAQRPPKIKLSFGDDVCRWQTQECPESAIGYDESYIREGAARHGLQVETLYPGDWSGRPDSLSVQDILLLRKSALG